MSPEEQFRRLRDPSRWDGPVPRASLAPSTAAAPAALRAPERRPAWRVAVVTATMAAAVAAVSVAAITLRPGPVTPSGPGGSPEPAPVTPTAEPAPSRSVSASPHPSASSTTTPPPAAPAACAPDRLVATAEPLDAAAGSAYVLVTLRDASPEPCTLGGFATVRFLTGTDHRTTGLPAANEPWTQGGAGTGTVRLAPKLGTAFVLLRISDAGVFDPARCVPVDATAIALRLPGASAALTAILPAPVSACSGNAQQLFASQVLAKRPVG